MLFMSNAAKQHETFLPILDFALPLYTNALIGDLEACHFAVVNGQNLAGVVAGRSSEWVRRAYEESRHTERLADDWCAMTGEELLHYSFEDLDDFSLATLAHFLMEGDHPGLFERNGEALMACLMSDSGSILLDYDWLFSDALEYNLAESDAQHIELGKRALAHNLKYKNGDRAKAIMQNLASDLLELGETAWALRIMVGLVRHNPTDFDVLEGGVLPLSQAGFDQLSLKMLSRARLFAVNGAQRHDLEDTQMMMTLSRKSERNTKPAVEDLAAELVVALHLKWEDRDNISIQDLAKNLIPDIDEIKVKSLPLAPC